MSMTQSIGCMPASHYTYMAACTNEGLKKILASKKITGNEIPKGVWYDLREFVEGVSDAYRKSPKNWPVALSVYSIVFSIWLRVCEKRKIAVPTNRREFKPKWMAFAALIKNVRQPRRLSSKEAALISELADLFEELYRKGESDNYAEHMCGTFGDNADDD